MISPSKKISNADLNENHNCATCDSLSCFILKNCSTDSLDEISAVKKCSYYRKGDRILIEGMESNGVHIISSGQVKLYKSYKDDEKFIIRFVKEGEIFGFFPIEESGEQIISAKAITDTVICFLDNASFHRLIWEHPEMLYGLLKFYNKELNELENKLLMLARMNVTEKIADTLINMYEAYGSKGNENTLNLILSRQEIANYAGTTKEQVSKILSEFNSKGIIRTTGKKIDLLKLNALKNITKTKTENNSFHLSGIHQFSDPVERF